MNPTKTTAVKEELRWISEGFPSNMRCATLIGEYDDGSPIRCNGLVAQLPLGVPKLCRQCTKEKR